MNSRAAYILIALFAALSLRAACVPTLTVSPRDANGVITVTAQVNQQCYPKDVGVSLDGQSVNYSHCNTTGVCSFTTQIPTSCWASNSVHTLQAWATCGHWYGDSLCSTPNESGVSGEVSLSYDNTPAVSLSMTPPDATWTSTATVTAHFQTAPFEQLRYLRLIRNGDINNVEIERDNIPAADYTWTFPVNLACRPGPLRFQAVAMACGHEPSDPSLNGWSGEIVLDPEVTPSTSLVIPDPGPTGLTTATAQAQFPFRLDDRRYLRIFRNGNIDDVVDELLVPNSQMSATLSTALNFACVAGSTTYRAAALVCGDWYGSIYGNRVPSNPEFIGLSDPVEMRDEADPDVSLTYATDGNGVDIATVTYAFYSTSSMQQRDLALYVDGALADARSVAETSGTYTVALPSCWHEARAVATACDQGGNSAFTDEATVQSPARKPVAELTLVKIPGEPTRRVNARYDVRRATGRVVIRLLPWISADGQDEEGTILEDLSIPSAPSSDHISVDLPLRPDQQARVRMTVEGCEIATADLAVDCAPCDGAASKNPVYYTDGNMRLSDTDPLPSIKGHALTRVYNSDEQVVALFGRGWTTLFDQRLMSEPEIVSVTTVTNEVVTFSLVGGVWRQTWPTARPARGSLSYNGAAGTYTYRAPGSLEQSVFRASDGKLVARSAMSVPGRKHKSRTTGMVCRRRSPIRGRA